MDGKNLGENLVIAKLGRNRLDRLIGIPAARQLNDVTLQLLQFTRAQKVWHSQIAVVHIEVDLLLVHHSRHFDSFAYQRIRHRVHNSL